MVIDCDFRKYRKMIDPIQLQSIVDGECTGSQRRALLAECEGEPQKWKILALALLEEQQFRKQIAMFDAKVSNEDSIVQSIPRERSSADVVSSLAAHPLSVNQAVLKKSPSEANSSIGLVADSDPYDGMPETDLRVRLPSTDYEIPIFDATDFDPTIALAKQEIEIQEANQRLRKQGFEIDMKPEYVMGKLQDGRQVIVPIHKVGLRPYGQ